MVTLRQCYGITQVVYIGFMCYIAVLPFIVPYIRNLVPSLWRCTYETIYHEPCPFCGATTYIYRFVVYGEPLPVYITLAALVLAEEVLRHSYICRRLLKKRELSKGFMMADLLGSLAAIALVLCCFLMR